MVERVDYDELGLFNENAAEHGLPYDGPQAVRRESVEVEPGRRLPDASVVRFDHAGHSTKGDMPVELAREIEAFVFE